MTAAPVEIERKFRVRKMPDLEGLIPFRVRQGYLTLPGDSVEVRLRQKDDRFFMTLKSEGGLERLEYEVQIDRTQFDTLWPATQGRRIEKTRHVGRLSSGEMHELDVFDGNLAQLTLVEVEFPSRAASRAFIPPDWFGADVTSDKRFKNKALAMMECWHEP